MFNYYLYRLVFFILDFLRLQKNVDERPKTYLEVLDIPSIRDVSENPSIKEKAFVANILDSIPPLNE
jgi:hypothetical protein